MKIIKQFPLIILIAIFLISCRTSTNKEYPINNLEKNITINATGAILENPNDYGWGGFYSTIYRLCIFWKNS